MVDETLCRDTQRNGLIDVRPTPVLGERTCLVEHVCLIKIARVPLVTLSPEEYTVAHDAAQVDEHVRLCTRDARRHVTKVTLAAEAD